ncbi:MAG: SDR family NAD(P)-dependent oxidoreductase [Vulcanisaeta sp.]
MGRVALVTGASSGIGRELAKELAIRRYDLVLVSRRRNVLEGLAEELRDRYGVNAWPIDHDLSDLGRINELVDRVRGLGIEVSVLVNNAGAGLYGPLGELNDDDIVRIVSLNYLTPILLTKKFLPDLAKNRGCVVNVISLAAYIPIPWFGIYTSSKAALANITDALRIELKPLGIRVIGVYPGYVRTNFHSNTIVTPTASRARDSPKGPVLDPGYVANKIAEKIDDPRFNGDIVPSITYRVAGVFLRILYPLVRYYVNRWFNKSIGRLA